MAPEDFGYDPTGQNIVNSTLQQHYFNLFLSN